MRISFATYCLIAQKAQLMTSPTKLFESYITTPIPNQLISLTHQVVLRANRTKISFGIVRTSHRKSDKIRLNISETLWGDRSELSANVLTLKQTLIERSLTNRYVIYPENDLK